MISIPVAVWTAFNALNCIFAAGKDQGTNKVGFAIALGTAALSCGLLSAGAIVAWLGMEITLWILHMGLAVLALAVRPPSHNNNDINTIAFGASIRLAIAMIVWLCI